MSIEEQFDVGSERSFEFATCDWFRQPRDDGTLWRSGGDRRITVLGLEVFLYSTYAVDACIAHINT